MTDEGRLAEMPTDLRAYLAGYHSRDAEVSALQERVRALTEALQEIAAADSRTHQQQIASFAMRAALTPTKDDGK